MDHTSKLVFDSGNVLRSHRPGEPPENYVRRLTRARLNKSELAEITALYARLNAERAALGLGNAEHAPWSPADILEWQDLDATEKYLDILSYAAACDRAKRPSPARQQALIVQTVTRQPRVLNKRDITGPIPPTAIYCGRPSPLGNPFVIGKDGTRDEVIEKHKAWLPTQPKLMAMMPGLKGLDLICHCAPARCHCDIYLELANPELRNKPGLRLLVCGGRDFNNASFLELCLDRAHVKTGIACIIEGGARGADTLAREWAKSRGCKFETYPADWEKHGKAAGFKRNQLMLDQAKPDGVIAFPGGNGTNDMIERTRKAGVKIWTPAPPA
jgi:hypothetical protein